MEQPPTSARRVSVGPQRLGRWLDGFGERHGGFEATFSDDLVALVGADGDRAWVEVPFGPLTGRSVRELIAHVRRDRRVGVLLVRRGGYAAGIFEGDGLVASKVGSSYVQGTTKAGGWSQQRYARRRANQASAAFAEAADVAVRIFGERGPQRQQLDALVVGGDRDGVHSVLADRRLAGLPEPAGPWLEVKDPRLRVLAATPEQFRAVRVSLDP